MDLLQPLLAASPFMPHGHCYLWQPGLLGLHAVSDTLTALAYFAIAGSLLLLVRRSHGAIPFRSVFLAFGLFILTCGLTHLMAVVTLWEPVYWTSGAVKAATATVSVGTALILPPLVPAALRTMRDARLSEARRVDLEQAHAELRGLYVRLQEADRLRAQFFANVSHELRTPLTLVLGHCENLQARAKLRPDERHDLEVAIRSAHLLREYVDDLLEAAGREAGELHARFVQTDLAGIIRRTAANFEGLAAEQGISYAVETPERLGAAVDPDKVQRIVLNLVGNAFKHTPPTGRITCRLEADPDAGMARMEVHDSGPGIPESERETVFESYRQLQREDGRTEGFGLGLALSRDFARLHGGDVHVGESPLGGARVTVSLRLAAPAGVRVRGSVPGELVPRLADGTAEEPADAARARVLVVEDNKAVNRFVVGVLAEAYDVVAAFDGQEGMEAAAARKPDLIVTDLMMPRMSGDEMVVELKKRPELAPIPVVVLTAREDQEMKVDLLRRGVADYVTKPFSAEELRARVGNLVQAKRARDVLNEAFAVQQTDLESLAREISRSQRELKHTLAQMAIARELAERASRVKSNFLRLMSHELRTPLTAIQLQLTLLKRSRTAPLVGPQLDAVERMERSARRQMDLIETILEYARIESGRFEIHPSELSLAALADEIAADFRPHAEQKGVELRRLGEVPPSFVSDRGLLRLVVVNLAGNAVKFTEAGSVEIRVEGDAEVQRLVVADTGPGIPPEQQAAIFEPFLQLEDVRYKHEPGSGLGLAIVKEMVEALGGTIEMDSEVGRGTIFTVTVPSLVENTRDVRVLGESS